MQLRLFTDTAATPSSVLVEEVKLLIRSKSSDEWSAGVDFFHALKQMRARQQLMAKPLPPASYAGLVGPKESLWERKAYQHSLYLSRVPPSPTLRDVEVRALMACNGVNPEPVRIAIAADRHRRM